METTLRMFSARALFALCFFFLVFFVAFAGVAFAQEAGPITVDQIAAPADYTGLAGLANSAFTGIATAIASLVVAIVARVWNLIPEWFRAIIEHVKANTSLKDTTDTAAWHKSLQELSHDGVILAATKVGLDPKSISSWEEKNAFLKLAGSFVAQFDDDIKAMIDKDGDGVPDVVQVALAKIAPQTATITPPPNLPPAQGFMSASTMEPRRMVKARASDGAVEALAQKFARQAKGAVKQ